MFSSVVLENFQSHQHSVFNFDKGLNLVVGSSNQGKTSLVRALSLVLYNVWDKSWVRIGSAFCKITLAMDNGITVIREKGEKVNRYILKIPGQTEATFENFGTEVPEAVSKILGIAKVSLDKDDFLTLNYAGQLEPLFLFNRSGSQKAKVFGRLSGAHYLDHALRGLATEKKQTNTEKNLKTQELESLKVQHTNLSKIYDYAPAMMGFLAAEGRIEEAQQHVATLKDLFRRVQDWKRCYTSESQHESTLARVPVVQIDSIETSVLRLKELKQLLNGKNDLDTRQMTLDNYKSLIYKDFESTTEQYLSTLRENSVCPTCFEQLNEQKMSKIQENLTGEHKCLA